MFLKYMVLTIIYQWRADSHKHRIDTKAKRSYIPSIKSFIHPNLTCCFHEGMRSSDTASMV